MTRAWRVAALGVAVLGAAPAVQAQQYFGQNQVEYHHLNWRVLETEHFRIYYYPEERVPVTDAGRMAERSYSRLSRLLGHQFREKKPILLYASRQDFSQSNINPDLPEGVLGVTEPLRQRMELPFTGDYFSFEHVLTHEMAHQFQFDVFSRGKAGENIQTLEQVNPPSWFLEGMAEYLSIGPNDPLTTMWVRDAIVNGTFPTIEQMTRQPERFFPYRYGEALWRYVGQRWGDAAIGEVLESVASVGVERGFQRELGVTLPQLSDQWREAVRAHYLPQLATMQRVRDFAQPLLNPKRTGGNVFIGPTLSPDGTKIAFYANGSERRGEVFIDLWLGDATTGKRIRRLVQSTTNPRFEELRLEYAQGGFSPDGAKFAFTAQSGGHDRLSIVDVNTGDVTQLTQLPVDGVLGPSWSPDGRHIVFSGLHGGLTDLYIVDPDGKNLTPITQDRYGDLQPSWSPDGSRIAWATDRGSTNLADLALGKMQIAVYTVADRSISILPNQVGTNINPVWSPDGSALAYISDRSGTANIYLHDFRGGQDLQVTNVLGGVSSFTEQGPAITWSHGTNRLAFTYYDNNDYTVWQLTDPRAIAHAIPVATTTPATAVASAAPMPVRDSTPGGSAGSSMYRSAGGLRPSDAQPAGTAVDSSAVSSIATMLADPRTGLPDTTSFRYEPYRIQFQPDYISGASIGVSTASGYGTFASGGTTLVFSDLTGGHTLAVGAGIQGQLSDASFLVGYGDLSHRLQYFTSVSQDVAYFYQGGQQLSTNNPNFGDVQYQFLRYVFRTAQIGGAYPLNRFQRFELGLQGTAISRGVKNIDYIVDGYGNVYDVKMGNGPSKPTLSFVAPTLSYVADNTLATPLTVVSGQRMRFTVAPSVGNLRWTSALADYRRYDPVIFNTLTFATRLYFTGSFGRDAIDFPVYLGRPDFVRGYDQSSFYGGYTCEPFLGATSTYGSGCATSQLIGTRGAVFNEELRFPIIRRFDLGPLPIGLPPVDGAIFYDAGVAWFAGQHVSLTRPAGFDPATQPDTARYLLRSWGGSIRVNLFNFLILRWDYAKPLDRPGFKKAFWTFSIGPTF